MTTPDIKTVLRHIESLEVQVNDVENQIKQILLRLEGFPQSNWDEPEYLDETEPDDSSQG